LFVCVYALIICDDFFVFLCVDSVLRAKLIAENQVNWFHNRCHCIVVLRSPILWRSMVAVTHCCLRLTACKDQVTVATKSLLMDVQGILTARLWPAPCWSDHSASATFNHSASKLSLQVHCVWSRSISHNNHASIPPLIFYRPDAFPATQPTVSKRQCMKTIVLCFLNCC